MGDGLLLSAHDMSAVVVVVLWWARLGRLEVNHGRRAKSWNPF